MLMQPTIEEGREQNHCFSGSGFLFPDLPLSTPGLEILLITGIRKERRWGWEKQLKENLNNFHLFFP